MNIEQKRNRDITLSQIGWSVYLVECADKSFFGGIARDMKKELAELNVKRKGRHFRSHPERVPVKIIFEEKGLPFREAYAKFCYLRKMNRDQRLCLINRKKFNNSWVLYMRGFRSIPRVHGSI